MSKTRVFPANSCDFELANKLVFEITIFVVKVVM